MFNENIVNNNFNIEQIEAHKLPFVYRQFLSKHKNRNLSFYNKFIDKVKSAIKKLNLPLVQREFFYATPSIMVDFVIIGDNPIVALILSNNISRKYKKAKVVIYLSEQVDHWGYECLLDADVLKIISDFYGVIFNKVDDFIDYLLKDFKSENKKIFFLDDRYAIKYSEFDEHLNSFYLHFTNEKLTSKNIDGYLEIQNEIKKIFKKSIVKKITEMGLIKKIIWKDVNREKNIFSNPIVISNKLILTSMPHGNWINIDSEQKNNEVIFGYKDKDILSYCSAKLICLSPREMKKKVIEDIREVLGE